MEKMVVVYEKKKYIEYFNFLFQIQIKKRNNRSTDGFSIGLRGSNPLNFIIFI